MNYTIENVGKGKAYLLEDGIQVALVTQAAVSQGYISDVVFKWYASRAEGRFQGFCDSISMSECVEALGFRMRYK